MTSAPCYGSPARLRKPTALRRPLLVTLPTAHPVHVANTQRLRGVRTCVAQSRRRALATTETHVSCPGYSARPCEKLVNRSSLCGDAVSPHDTSGSPSTNTYLLASPHRFTNLRHVVTTLHRRPCLQLRQRGRWLRRQHHTQSRVLGTLTTTSLPDSARRWTYFGHTVCKSVAMAEQSYMGRVKWFSDHPDTALSLALTKASFRARTSSYMKY
jgi:hypothetical protein